jgi:cephalosporin hydroxylase
MTSKNLVKKAFKLGMAQETEEITEFTEWLSHKKINNFIEIGCKLGGTFQILCESIKGKKISVDLPGGMHGGWMTYNHPYLGDIYKIRNTYFTQTYKDVYMVTGDSHESNTLNDVKSILNGDNVDLLFIDGDHTYEGVKQDYLMYKSLVNSGGYIVFHDINDTPHHRNRNVYVGKLWNELRGEKIEFNINKHWAGIGVIKKD